MNRPPGFHPSFRMRTVPPGLRQGTDQGKSQERKEAEKSGERTNRRDGSIEITSVGLREGIPVYLKQLDEHIIGRGHHDVFPYADVRDALLERYSHGLEPFNHAVDIVRLNPEMVNASPAGEGRRLVVEVNPPRADSHEHISRPGHILIQNNFSAKGVLIKGQALFDIRRKQMNMVDMVHGISPFLPGARSHFCPACIF